VDSPELLRTEHLDVAYGIVQVLWDVSIAVGHNEVVALVGSNGAGKTTLLRTLSGLLTPLKGTIFWEGRDITHLPPEERVNLGIAMVPEGRQLFPGLTVEENLLMGAYRRKDRAQIRRDLEQVYMLFPRLRERYRQLAGTLSGGEQQMVAIGRGLMAAPRLLMIDEMSLGLAPLVVDELVEVVAQIKAQGKLSLLIVEQDVEVALGIADRGYVIETGRIVLSGSARELLTNEAVRGSFLGL
jgi:branched-chain amino acid transport system ATP-binding protein